jgi:hypothetical protein
MSEGHTTTDHEKIKKWASDRDGMPATVKETEKNGHAGILRIDFGPREAGLEEISWDEFSENSKRPAWRSCTKIKPRMERSAASTSSSHAIGASSWRRARSDSGSRARLLAGAYPPSTFPQPSNTKLSHAMVPSARSTRERRNATASSPLQEMIVSDTRS